MLKKTILTALAVMLLIPAVGNCEYLDPELMLRSGTWIIEFDESWDNSYVYRSEDTLEGEYSTTTSGFGTATFEDFNLKLEVNVPKGSNSGVYLRGIYEVQVMDSYGRELDSHNMGGLYSRITPSEAAEKPAGEWQSMDITLFERHLTVKLNGKTIIDNQPVKGVTGGALTSDQFSPGPILLQGDHGKVSYRNIILRPISKK